jgi:hypothetical protein
VSGQGFDELTKTLAEGTASRRKFLAGLGTVAAAVLVGPRGAAAIPGDAPGSGDCVNEGQSCTAQKCCQGFDCLVDLTSSTEKFCCSPNSTLVCGRSCCPTGALGNCSAGQCVCPTGEVVCPDANNPLAGKCVNLVEDPDNCGACGVVCTGPIGADAPCRVRACVQGQCTTIANPLADGALCEEGNLCTVGDTCNSGTCQAGTPVTCPDEQCQTCVPSTGLCQPRANGTPCSDENPCTLNDTCQAGFCTPGPLKECPQCQVCDPTTGTCEAVANGTPCNDNDVCTAGDTCQNGACQSGSAVPGCCHSVADCPTPPSPCQQATCVNNACGVTNKANGTVCNDNNPCTQNDVCTNGVCAGTAIAGCIVCQSTADCPTPSNQCQQATCTNNVCGVQNKPNGTACNDNNACTSNDVCMNGVCTGTPCASPNVCCPQPGRGCRLPNGVACNGNGMCCSGNCSGNPRVCQP